MIIKKIKNKISSQKIFNFYISRYVIVGLINTVVGYVAFFLFTRILNQYVFALLLSHIVGVTNSYFWNKYLSLVQNAYPDGIGTVKVTDDEGNLISGYDQGFVNDEKYASRKLCLAGDWNW